MIRIQSFIQWYALRSVLLTALIMSGNCYADEKAEMAQLQKDIEALQQDLKRIQGTRSSLQKDLQKSETDIGDLEKKADKIKKELQREQQELEKLDKERSSLEQQQRQQQQQIAEQIRAAYKLGEQSEIKVMLNQESPDQLSRIMKYHSYFMNAHNTKMQHFLDTTNQINALIPEIEKKTFELEQKQAELAEQRKSVANIHKTRAQALAKVNAQVKDKNQELQKLAEDRSRLQTLLTTVARKVAATNIGNSPAYVPLPKDGEKFSQRKGRLPWPAKGSMVHRFGSSRVAGQMSWNGAFITAPMGTPVIAVHHGRIVFADYFGGHGLLVIVDHGEGYLSLYAHNQSLLKKAGEVVKAGDAIASIGNSGGQATTGVYFEIRRQGKPIDPGVWLARG